MKKLFRNSILMAAAIAFSLTSCNNTEDLPNTSGETALVSIRIAGANNATRSVENPAPEPATPNFNTGVAFVVSTAGAIEGVHGLDIGTAADQTGHADGQELGIYSSESRVFVVGNYPGMMGNTVPAALDAISNLTLLLAHVQEISTQSVTLVGHEDVVLANVGGTVTAPVVVVPSTATTPGEALATVTIAPVISRLELHRVTASATPDDVGQVYSFDVTGVFVDDYHSRFTLGGSFGGTLNSINEGVGTWAADWVTANMGVTTPFSSRVIDIAGTDQRTVVPFADGAAQKVYAFNLASGATPRLVIRLENIKWVRAEDIAADPDNFDDPAFHRTIAEPNAGVRYITVTNWNNSATPFIFQPGRIYTVGAGDEIGLKFNMEDITITPNPQDMTLSVHVVVANWIRENLTPNL